MIARTAATLSSRSPTATLKHVNGRVFHCDNPSWLVTLLTRSGWTTGEERGGFWRDYKRNTPYLEAARLKQHGDTISVGLQGTVIGTGGYARAALLDLIDLIDHLGGMAW